jgi:hypothetical protein
MSKRNRRECQSKCVGGNLIVHVLFKCIFAECVVIVDNWLEQFGRPGDGHRNAHFGIIGPDSILWSVPSVCGQARRFRAISARRTGLSTHVLDG